ncbi:MAG: hypothetical protein LBH25_05115 [Fibromonadaceae bacterium]|jgi:hypothetical protein|nr:hypothetical protein [Fibromonadaceae bacterium]
MKYSLFLAFFCIFLLACGGSGNSSKKEVLHIPTNMPEVCQNVDFNVDKKMRETCGVKPVRYQAYRNVPMQRYLVNPSQASIVKTGGKIEIRFPNTFPVQLDSQQIEGVLFSSSKRLTKIENTMDYNEFYTEKKERFKLFKLTIPSDTKPVVENHLCFRVPELRGSDRTRSAAMGVQMEMLSCATLDSLVSTYSQK